MARPRFENIRFGYAGAEEESTYEPSLLTDGFFDPGEFIQEAKAGRRFLFLGYKGSGKSALAEHLRLSAENDSNLFVTTSILSDFPYSDLPNVVNGASELESRLPTAWSWLILLALFDSFSKDQGLSTEDRDHFTSALDVLGNLGLLPTPSLKKIVQVSSKKTFKISLPKFIEAGIERTSSSTGDIPNFAERLRLISATLHSPSKHLLVIDGLDEVLTRNEIQYQSLSALITESARLNMFFHRNGTPAKIILLCRTDLFERLPSANKNKIRQDSAIHLDWYHDPRQPSSSMLLTLANLRARLVFPEVFDIFLHFFPHQVDRQDTRAFLLDLTRHTPRDFLQLLSHVQKSSTDFTLSRDNVLSGVRRYSIDYFLPEIRDELHGYVAPVHIDLAFDLIGSLRKRDFEYHELAEKASEANQFKDLPLESIIRALFECSAIGNVHNRPGGTTYYTFRFRNRNSTLNLHDRLILHRGMWKAMNLI